MQNHLRFACMSYDNSSVRFGCLTGDRHRGMIASNPENLAGLCGRTRSLSSVRLPSQGPAPLSTWGFSLGECFVVRRRGWTRCLHESVRIKSQVERCPEGRPTCDSANRTGISADSFTGLTGYSWNQAQPAPQSICTDRQGASANGPAWAAPRITGLPIPGSKSSSLYTRDWARYVGQAVRQPRIK